VRGEPLDRDRHEADMEVKAVTWHGYRVQKTANGFEAEIIFDI
jgi:SHS2 domain-containing protein